MPDTEEDVLRNLLKVRSEHDQKERRKNEIFYLKILVVVLLLCLGLFFIGFFTMDEFKMMIVTFLAAFMGGVAVNLLK